MKTTVAAAVLAAALLLAAAGSSSSGKHLADSQCRVTAITSSAAAPFAVAGVAVSICTARELVISMTICLQREGLSIPWANRSCESVEKPEHRTATVKLTHICDYTTIRYKWRAQVIAAVVGLQGGRDSGVATGNVISEKCA